jgi:hypothetical protein
MDIYGIIAVLIFVTVIVIIFREPIQDRIRSIKKLRSKYCDIDFETENIIKQFADKIETLDKVPTIKPFCISGKEEIIKISRSEYNLIIQLFAILCRSYLYNITIMKFNESSRNNAKIIFLYAASILKREIPDSIAFECIKKFQNIDKKNAKWINEALLINK